MSYLFNRCNVSFAIILMLQNGAFNVIFAFSSTKE